MPDNTSANAWPNTPLSGNLLSGVVPPPGSNATIGSFTVPGVPTPITPGSGPVPVVDPATNKTTGTIQVYPNGNFTFQPAPGYAGPVPPVNATVVSSDGQTDTLPLAITVVGYPPPSPPPSPPAPPVRLQDGNEALNAAEGTPVRTNVLNNAIAPPGSTVSVASFTIAGSNVTYTPSRNPVTVVDPISGLAAGTLVVRANGDVTFTPAPGFTGPVPEILTTVKSSDGQTNPSSLSINVLPGRLKACHLRLRG